MGKNEDEEHEKWLKDQPKSAIIVPPGLPAGSVQLGGDYSDESPVHATPQAKRKPRPQGTAKSSKARFGGNQR